MRLIIGKRMRGVVVAAVVLVASAGVLLACGASSNAASAVGGSGSSSQATTQHFKLGQHVKVGNTWIVTVTGFKVVPGDDITSPQAGNKFVEIDVTLQNVSGQQQDASSLLNFTFRDSTGQEYTETFVDGVPSSPDGPVEAGQQIRGSFAYEVPAAQKKFTLAFQSDIFSSGEAIWDLSL